MSLNAPPVWMTLLRTPVGTAPRQPWGPPEQADGTEEGRFDELLSKVFGGPSAEDATLGTDEEDLVAEEAGFAMVPTTDPLDPRAFDVPSVRGPSVPGAGQGAPFAPTEGRPLLEGNRGLVEVGHGDTERLAPPLRALPRLLVAPDPVFDGPRGDGLPVAPGLREPAVAPREVAPWAEGLTAFPSPAPRVAPASAGMWSPVEVLPPNVIPMAQSERPASAPRRATGDAPLRDVERTAARPALMGIVPTESMVPDGAEPPSLRAAGDAPAQERWADAGAQERGPTGGEDPPSPTGPAPEALEGGSDQGPRLPGAHGSDGAVGGSEMRQGIEPREASSLPSPAAGSPVADAIEQASIARDGDIGEVTVQVDEDVSVGVHVEGERVRVVVDTTAEAAESLAGLHSELEQELADGGHDLEAYEQRERPSPSGRAATGTSAVGERQPVPVVPRGRVVNRIA